MNKNILISFLIIVLVIAGGWYLLRKPTAQNLQNIPIAPSSSTAAPTVKIGKVAVDMQAVQELQAAIDQGHQPWRNDPKNVAIVDSSIYPEGLATKDDSLQAIKTVSLQTGKNVYILPFEGKQYEVTVIQPVVGENKVWVVSDIEYATNETTANWLTYTNSKFGFQFKYPPGWKIEEVKSEIGTSIHITNPDFPKKVYDCCYTRAQVQQYGHVPVLEFQIINSDTYYSPEQKNNWPESIKNLFNQLVAKGYSQNSVERTLNWIPIMGEYERPDPTSPVTWVEVCKKSEIIQENNHDVIKSTGCSDGIVEDTEATFVEQNNYIFRLYDSASEYSKIEMFDKILGSIIVK